MGLLEAFRDPQFRRDLGTNAGQLGQSMSNTAASSVTAPVDAIAWLLRRARIPVPENALGGSEWARQAGLLADVPDGLPKVAGETLGLLAPMAGTQQGAAAVAKGLRQMGENAAAPRTMNPQTGAIVWHGSPHKFDKFDASKIGTGEGAQAYGHGLYLAESPDVAKSYADDIIGESSFRFNGLPLSEIKPASELELVYLKNLRQYKDRMRAADATYAETKKAWSDIQKISEKASFDKGKGSLYKVDLPDDQIARMLDWELPLSQQSGAIQNIARSADIKTAPGSKASGIINAWREGRDVGVVPKGGDLHHAMTNFGKTEPAAFSEMLRNSGIPGIRYLDEGSRNAGKGTSNFVVFPGNERLLRILERNGQALP